MYVLLKKDEIWVVWFKKTSLELLAISVATSLCLLSNSVCPLSDVN